MANDKSKSKGTNGDDVLIGTPRNDKLSGRDGDDFIDGGAGNDRLYGGKGDDVLLGGSGNDVIYGDKGKGGGWDDWCWWKPKSSTYDDFIDGGAGSDKVFAGRGDDVVAYSMAGNLGAGFKNVGAHDEYDGGTGSDTLLLQLTYGEYRLASVQQDIAAFQKFLAGKADARSDHGKEFEFKSFNLDVSNFEALQIQLVNTGPTARGDSGATDENTKLVVAGPALLANDSDPDHLDVLSVIAGSATSAKGAAVVLSANGGYSYDPSGALELQKLALGQTATDTFSYTIADLGGATSTATVSITVTGVNDAPVASPDSFTLDEDTTLSANVLGNDTDIDSPTLSAALVSGTTHGSLMLDANGSFTYTPDADFNGTDSFTYKASDGTLASNVATVNLTINPVNDAPVVEDVVIGGGQGGGGGDAAASQGDPFLITSALLLAGATDPEGDPLFISEVSPVSELGASVSIDGDGNIVYDPTEGLKYLAEGEIVTDTFTYTVSDGHDAPAAFARFASVSLLAGSGSTATVSLTVKGVNDAPVANPDSFTLNEDTTLTVAAPGVTGNDADVDSPSFTAAVVSGTAHGSLSFNPDGSFSYTPNANFFGSDSFTYKTNDGSLDSNVATVSLTVNDVSDAEPSKVLPSVDSSAGLDYFIKFADGDWMRLENFSLGMSQSGSLASGGGGGAGKATATDVQTLLGTSGQLVELGADLTAGKHLPTVEIEVYGAGQEQQLLEQFYFEDVLLTSLQTSAGTGGATVHNLSFDYEAFNRGHLTQDAKGAVGPAAEDGFDFKTVSDADGLGPAIHGDAIKAKLENVDSDSLQYYVSWEGSGGWLQLGSFSMGVAQTGSTTAGGGGGTGKAVASDLSFTLGASAQLLQLEDALTSGKHLENLEIEAYRTTSEGRQLADQYVFENLLVSSLQTSNAVFNSVSVDFSRFNRAHVELDEKGGVGPIHQAGWDFESNTKFNGSPVDADLGKDSPLSSVDSSANLDYFIRFGDQDWMQMGSFSLGMSQSGSLGSGGGGGAGKATATDISTFLGTSGQLVQLGSDLTSGKHLPTVEIEVYRAGQEQQLVEQFYFEEVLVTGLQTSAGSGSGTGNSLSFDYAAFNRGHLTQDEKGAVGPAAEDGFDFASVTDADGLGPAIHGDAIKAKLENVDSLDSNLQYYVSWDGSGGWLHLGSFSVGAFNTGSTTVGGGGGAGKAIATDLSFTLGASAQLLQLEDALTSGKHLENLEIEAYRTSSKGLDLVDQYVFEDLLVNGLSTSDAVFNSVSVEFAKFSRGHVEFDEKGAKSGTTEAGWDFVDDSGFSAPVDADLGKNSPLPSVDSSENLDYFIRFEGQDWMRLESFSLSMSQSGSLHTGGGGGAGKATASDIHTTLGTSGQLVQLSSDLTAGKHVPSVEIEVYRAGQEQQLVEQFYFEDVLVTGLQTSASSGGTGHSLTFDYTAFNRGHLMQDEKGAVGPAAEDGFNFKTVSDADGIGPAIHGDAIKAKLENVDSLDTNLQYYVSWEGSGGWLQLNSFSVGVTQTGSTTTGGGAGAGKASATDLFLSLGASAQLLQLEDALTSGKHLKGLEIEAYHSGGKGQELVDQYVFEDLLVTSLQTSDAVSNSVSVEFAKFSRGHVEFDEKGAKSATTEAGWDFEHNVQFHAPVDSDLF